MWYKAKCIRECTFRGSFRYVGSLYEGRVKPPHHFKILSVTDDGESEVKNEKRRLCPYCGNVLPESMFPTPEERGDVDMRDEETKKSVTAEFADKTKGMKFPELKALADGLGIEYAETVNYAKLRSTVVKKLKEDAGIVSDDTPDDEDETEPE